MSSFKDKVLLITGGTGSFGNAVLRRFLNTDIKEIRIFSRDEKKQDDMRHRLQNPKVKFYMVVSQKVCKAECLFELQMYLFFFALLPINNKDRPRKN